MNCRRRDEPTSVGPSFSWPVMTPKLGSEISDAGSPKIGWLSRLNASNRNFTASRSVMAVFFSSAESIS